MKPSDASRRRRPPVSDRRKPRPPGLSGSPPPVGVAADIGGPARSWWARWTALLDEPVPGASLAAFRVALGLVMALEAWALCRANPDAISVGTTPLETYYTGADIRFHLPYEAFQWLPLLPAPWIHAVVALLALAGLTMALGLWYRASAAVVFLTWGYLWVVESTRTYWQSHYYLEVLLTFLMIGMPAARRYSLDAWFARHRPGARTVPFWTVLLLRGQLVIAYFYAGVAKLNADWLLDAVPVRWFLAQPGVTAPLGSLLPPAQLEAVARFLHSTSFAYFISYTGALFDLAVGFLLLFRRTRVFGLVLMVAFHALNHLLIFDDIGWFPLVGISTALIFLEPDWPERLGRWLRRPWFPRPDWRWLAAGAFVFPVVGAALGWKSAPAPAATGPRPAAVRPWARRIAVLVVAWLAWQALVPLRHYLIPGDGRFTYEGLSFSWRLKTDSRHAFAVQLFIRDPAIIGTDAAGRPQVNWNQWLGDRVIYRKLLPGRIQWAQVPEVFTVIEPLVGERIFYNPFAAPAPPRTEAEARERVRLLWQELYGRPPKSLLPTRPLAEVLADLAAALRPSNPDQADRFAALAPVARQLERNALTPPQAAETLRTIRAALHQLSAPPGGARPPAEPAPEPLTHLLPLLDALPPFVLEGERPPPAPFLLIEDPDLLTADGREVNRAAWRNSAATRDPRRPLSMNLGAEPLIIFTDGLGPEGRDLLPQACIFDAQDRPERAPYIWWNSLKDLTSSKLLHLSNQAFYLRRYARRIAGLWEEEHGRRPIVTALTEVSLNGRPHQPLVDPAADLASVPVTWFGHNPWVRDLQTPRVPREALPGRGLIGP